MIFTKFFKKAYRPFILPILLFGIAFLTLTVPLSNGDITHFATQPLGLAMILMIVSVVYLEYLFTSPRDAILNSLNALIISVVFWESLRINFWLAFIFSSIVLFFGILFLVTYDKNKKIGTISKPASYLGKAKVIFPIVAALTLLEITSGENFVGINIDSNILYLLFFYLIFLSLTTKNAIELIKNLPLRIRGLFYTEDIGFVRSNLAPNIVIVEFSTKSKIKINDLVVIGDHDINNKDFETTPEIEDRVGLVLDFLGAASEKDMCASRVCLINEPQRDLDESRSGLVKLNQECKKVNNPDEFIEKINSEKIQYLWKRRDDIVALVTSLSNINVLKGEIVRHQQLENAQLVSYVNHNTNNPIRYQIIDAETRKEGYEDKKDFGYTQLLAYQLGEWRKPKDTTSSEIPSAFKRFFEFQWVPNVNSLILKWSGSADGSSASEEGVQTDGHYLLGTIPKTNLPIYLNINDLVSHHTAILGVTGTGKTTMVLKLIDAIKTNNIFTICLDITGEYRNKISSYEDFFDQDTNDKWVEQIDKILDARKRTQYSFTDTNRLTKEDAEKIEEDAIKEINKIIKDRIATLREENKIVILEIPEISNTYFSLDFTQYVIQAILQYAKDVYVDNLSKETEEEKDNFQCCLVLEEAHTLVPENLGVGGDYGASKAVIDKISQIALQGRKYNVGFILVSQRTATVKKTVLNQCNTMIAFRAYDETSFTFLSNYFGDEYVREIIHLKNDGDSRYVIVAGKAVVADRPVIVEVKKEGS